MRTTISLENDVAKRQEYVRNRRDSHFKPLLNEAIRQGVDALNVHIATR